MKVNFSILCSTCLFNCLLMGQNFTKCNSELVLLFGKIGYYSSYNYNENDNENKSDSLAKYNAAFEKLLLACTSEHPESLQASFKSLDTIGVHINTSPDGNFRIYSWDTQDGGTMHNFRNLFQYKSNGKTSAKLESADGNGENPPDPGRLFFELNEVVSEGKKFYLASSVGIYSSAASNHTIQVFSIEDGKLNDKAALIKTKTGIRSQLSYTIDLTDPANAKIKLSDYTDLRIDYDQHTKTIILPLINENGGLTKKKIKYRFDGKYFVKVK